MYKTAKIAGCFSGSACGSDFAVALLVGAIVSGKYKHMRMLLDHGVDPSDGKALGIAAARNDTEALKLLLPAGADPNNGAPLVSAVYWGSRQAESVLRAAGANPKQKGRVRGRELQTSMYVPVLGLEGAELPSETLNAHQVSWLRNFQRGWGMNEPLEFSAQASSALPDYPPYSYGAQMAFDGEQLTAWNALESRSITRPATQPSSSSSSQTR